MVSASTGVGPAKAISNTVAAAPVRPLTPYIPVIPFIFLPARRREPGHRFRLSQYPSRNIFCTQALRNTPVGVRGRNSQAEASRPHLCLEVEIYGPTTCPPGPGRVGLEDERRDA